ncbi:MAG: DNA polymerase III subunit delta, partial [Clostridia bacterium]|nr:DNA polymerase III subunit delta [Clostridia bacterium]
RTLMRKKVIPDPDMGFFDHIRLSGADKSNDPDGASLALRLSSAMEGLPVMNEGKLIEIAEPGFADMKAAELKEFCTVLESLPDYPYVTVLILCAEEEFPTDFRAQTQGAWKPLEKAGMHIIPFPQQTRAKLIPWCAKHFASEGISASQDVIDAMLDRVGLSMTALSGEMQKLCAYLHANGRDTVAHGDVALVCARTETAGDFAVSNAIRERDIGTLVRTYTVLKNEKTEAISLFFQISSAITELWRIKQGLADGYSKEDLMRIHGLKEYPMRLAMQGCTKYSLETLSRLVQQCAETDILLKSSPVDGYVLVERLISAMSARYESNLSEKETTR